MQNNEKPLFIFEMANNHMGSVEHGLRIIDEFSSLKGKYEHLFDFAFKFQFRHFESFIHPDYKNRMDLKYIKRFSETKLTEEEFFLLNSELKKQKFISICTGFDEKSIDLIEKMDFSYIKIASCSFTDWPLLERIAKSSKPVIASCAGSGLSEIDNVVSFFQHRDKSMILMHCVGEYPTEPSHLQLNQIDLFKNRYHDIKIGFSTHEDPDNLDSIKIAVSKGATVFEKHVAVVTEKYEKNAYSATPEQVENWLKSALSAFEMCGVKNMRSSFSDKEIADLRQFKRGVYSNNAIKKGEALTSSNIFYAFPNQKDQLVANDISKYSHLIAKQDIRINDAISTFDVEKIDTREKIYSIVQKVKDLLLVSNIVFPGKAELEISHHYGIDSFYETGLTMITVVNRDYCKKILIMLPGQEHPEQYHKRKEETFLILYGSIEVKLDGASNVFNRGDVVIVKPGTKHAFKTSTGTIFEEISSSHYVDDSFYTDESINNNPLRKTFLSYWLD